MSAMIPPVKALGIAKTAKKIPVLRSIRFSLKYVYAPIDDVKIITVVLIAVATLASCPNK